MAEKLLTSVTLVGIAERSIVYQHCSAGTLVPEKLTMLKLVMSWLISEVCLLTNSGLWEVMVLTLPFSQKGYARLCNPISTCWKALKQYLDFLVVLCPSQTTVATISPSYFKIPISRGSNLLFLLLS